MQSYRQQFSEYADRLESQSHFLHLVLPSIVRPGEPFALKAVMMDASGMPDEGWTGRIGLAGARPGLRLPQDYLEFGPDAGGRARLEGLVAEEPGAFWVTATPPDCPGSPPVSNAALARPDGPRLFWGDIHMHTVVGNCHPDRCKSPDFGYWYGREVSLLDFASATDHLRGIHRLEGNWDELKQSARRHNVPGEFVTFLAFESSHATGYGGDNNIYYNADDADYFWRDREDMKGNVPKVGLDELWGWLDRRAVPYLSIPHHTGRAAKYRDFENRWHNPDRETVMEVFSWWGSSDGRHDDLYLKGGKTDRRAYWRDALELGYRYGVIGSSDTHNTMPGTPLTTIPANYHYPELRLNAQGMAAVWAGELRRDTLFNALLARRCYASTWWRPVVELSVDGVQMGAEQGAVGQSLARRRVTATVAASGAVRVELLRNNRVIDSRQLAPGLSEVTWEDDEPLEKVVVRDAPKSEKPFAFYYLKLYSVGQVAWSSPVWLAL